MNAIAESLTVTRADRITPESIAWLWKGWLAQGKLHIVAGAPGTGKTTLALALAATITTGGRWPDKTRAPVGDVFMWSGEDDPRDTLLPRLMAMEAERSRVHFVGGVNGQQSGKRAFDPAFDIPLLAAAFAKSPDVRLLIIDPIVSAVAADGNKNNDVRRGLQALVDLAAKNGCALIGITHYSKRTAGGDPLERVTGSLAFGAMARLVFGTAKSPDPYVPRRLVRVKSNICADGGGFEYELQEVEVPGEKELTASRVLWRGPIEGDARELLSEIESPPGEDDNRGVRDDAAAWLADRLKGCTALTSEVKADGARQGHSWRTLQRARKDIGAVSGRHGFGKGAVTLWAPTKAALEEAIDARNAESKNVAPMDDLAPMGEELLIPGG